jgi:hypothetical protein
MQGLPVAILPWQAWGRQILMKIGYVIGEVMILFGKSHPIQYYLPPGIFMKWFKRRFHLEPIHFNFMKFI